MRKIYLIRHGETEWTLSGQHTGTTDIPLTPNGEKQSEALAHVLKNHAFPTVLTSPMQRARQTCDIMGLSREARIEPLLMEWNYGDYEGITTKKIQEAHPNWNIFKDGAPGGESVEDMQKRVDRLLASLQNIKGDIALFSHGHFLRSLGARYIGLPVSEGKHLALAPGSLSILSFERTTPVIALWNSTFHK